MHYSGQDADTFVRWSPARQGDSNQESLRMYKAFYVIAALSILTVQAEARPHHPLHRIQYLPQSVALQAGGERVVGSRPAGCPNRFCGCEASLYKFGRIIPGLNLASNWRRFPRTAPASGMAAVRSGHVMILEQHIGGDVWLVHDGNSGGHVTREHPRSIAGYTVVDPSSGSASGFGVAGVGQTAPSYASAPGWSNAYAWTGGRTLVASTSWRTVSHVRRRHWH
jgi:hypothetical protein